MKWGDTKLNIIKDSYIPPHAETVFTDIPLIPTPGDFSEPASIVQQGGRGRYKTQFSGFVKTYAEYQALENDYLGGVVKVFDGADGFSMDMFIFDIKPTRRSLYPTKIYYDIVLWEAEAGEAI